METYWVFHLAASWRGLPSPLPAQPVKDTLGRPSIRAAAVQMVFASRSSQEFITPEHVTKLEAWGGQAVLEALCAMDISEDVCVNELGSRTQLMSLTRLAIAPSERKRLGLGECSFGGSTVSTRIWGTPGNDVILKLPILRFRHSMQAQTVMD